MWIITKTVLSYLLLTICCAKFDNISRNSEFSLKKSFDYFGEVIESEVPSDEKSENGTSSGVLLNRVKRDVSGEKPRTDQISLVIIFDDTGSMGNDLAQLRQAAKDIINVLAKQGNIYNYILVAFNDPAIKSTFETSNQNTFLEALDKIVVFGGGDCPELAIGGLVQGLQVALPNSQAYVFTDASAKDYHLYENAGTLVQSKQITVSFLLTSICGSPSHPGNTVFHKLAEQSNGQVYNLLKQDIRALVAAISSELDPTAHPLVVMYEPAGTNKIKVDVDKTMKNLTVGLSGSDAKIDFTDPDNKPFKDVKNVLTLPKLKIVRVDGPNPGKWLIQTQSTSNHSIKITGFTNLRIKYGFSFDPPYEFSDTVTDPIKNVDNILSIFVQKTDNLYNMTEAEIVLANPGKEESFSNFSIKKSGFSDCQTGSCMYVTEGFKPPLGPFKIHVKGFDSDGNPLKYLASNAIQAVDGDLSKPKVTIDRATIEAVEGQKVEIMCKVVSPIPPTVNWIIRDDYVQPDKTKKIFSNENSTFYYRIDNVNGDDAGRYVCSAKNPYGEESAEVILKVKLIHLRVQLKETDMVATENGENYEINCMISPPERKVTVTWFLDDKLLEDSIDVQISTNSLLLNPVNRKHAGKITCIGDDGREKLESSGTLNIRYQAEIIGPPKEYHNITFDERVVLNCSAIGNPIPTIIWRNENSTEVRNIIEKFTPDDYGMYVCEASNGIGTPSRKYVQLNSTAKGPPTLIHSAYLHRLKLDDNLKLKCGCDQCGPIIHSSWKYLPESVSRKNSKSLEGTKRILEDRSKNFQYDFELKNVKESDDGYYICAIGNKFGVKTAIMHVKVLEKPQVIDIVVAEAKNATDGFVKVNRGTDARLLCKVKGSPSPDIEWSKDGVRLLTSNSFIKNGLILRNIKESEIGKYKCLARNSLGQDSKELQLFVTHPFLNLNTIIATEEGQLVILPCKTQKWTFNDKPLDIKTSRFQLIDNDLLFQANYNDSGVYKCIVDDEVPAAETIVIVNVAPSVYPKVDDSVYVRRLSNHSLKCRAEGYPIPKISWTLNGKEIDPTTASNAYGGDLLLKKINEKMIGSYACHATNKVGHAQRTTNVNIKSRPTITSLFESEINAVDADTNAQLICTATGIPKPILFWIKDGQKYTTGPSQNMLDVTFRTISGSYTCIAKNSEGEDRRTVEISSLGPPKLSDTYLRSKVHLVEGTELRIYCPFSKVKSIVWFKNGIKFESERMGPVELFYSPSVQLADAGNYTCLVENEAGNGTYTQEVKVFPSYGPEKYGRDGLQYRKIKAMASERTVLSCLDVRGDIEFPIKWIRNNRIISYERNLIFNNVQLIDAGKYECMSMDEGSMTPRSFLLTVSYSPQANMSTDNWHAFKEGEKVELECIIHGYPNPELVWQKNDSPRNETGTVLLIQNFKKEDQGIYKCTGSNEHGAVKIIHHVNSLESPRMVARSEKNTEGKDFRMYCHATGSPRPVLVWSFKGKILLGSGEIPAYSNTTKVLDKLYLDEMGAPSRTAFRDTTRKFYGEVVLMENAISLTLFIVSKDHKLPGFYTCHAVNVAGENQKEVQVRPINNVPPYLKETNFNETKQILAGLPIILTCPWYGEPTPLIKWFKNNSPINHSYYSQDGQTLTLETSKATDSGLYNCSAQNVAGYSEKLFNINVLAPSYYSIADERLDSNDFSLNCPVSNRSAMVYWAETTLGTLNRTNVLPKRSTKLTPSKNQDYAVYTCYSESSSDKIAEIQVLKTPAVNHYDIEKTATEDHTIILNCPMVLETPRPHIVWFKNGNPLREVPGKHFLSKDRMTLTIGVAKKDDAGIYNCRTHTMDGRLEGDINVKIRRPTSWSEWNPWGPCSQSCGGGMRQRARECILRNGEASTKDDEPCNGKGSKNQSCNLFPCPINGSWGEWSGWSECSGSCWDKSKAGPPTIKRYRECNSPPPYMGGKLCDGRNIEEAECNTKPCSVDGEWSSWSPWSACSVTCGKGTKIRRRKCDNPAPAFEGRYCSGEPTETEMCLQRQCPIHGGWTDWSEFSECSKTCGKGFQIRTRSCTNPKPRFGGKLCIGTSRDIEFCTRQKCHH